MPRKNYKAVVHKLLEEGAERGYKTYKVNDSEEEMRVTPSMTDEEIVEFVTAADEGLVYMEKDQDRIVFYLVYGNLMEETIADMTDRPEAIEISDAVAAHFEGQ